MMKIATVMLFALALGGCSAARGYIAVGEEATKSAKDIEAGLAIQAPCLAGLGAGGRMWSFREQQIVAELCNYMIGRPE